MMNKAQKDSIIAVKNYTNPLRNVGRTALNKPIMIDPHRHFGGSISPEFVWSMIHKHGQTHLATDITDVRRQMTFHTDEQTGFHRFLNKFNILNYLNWTPEAIDNSIAAICAGLETEEVDYAFMDLSIGKYLSIKWSPLDALKFIYNCFEQYRPGKVGLVLSVKYEAPESSQRRDLELIHTAEDLLIGVDFVGDEEAYNPWFLAQFTKYWRSSGKMVRAHVGEFGPEANIKSAFEQLGVTSVAHGIKLVDKGLMLDMSYAGINFDLGLTSNILTGVHDLKTSHAINRFLENKMIVTIGTDDPITCNTSLSREYDVAKLMGVDDAGLETLKLNATHLKKFSKSLRKLL